jgi:7-cyano-7-deazaguanine synthase
MNDEPNPRGELSPALVLLSGGQDSATCLLWAKKRFGRVHAISFVYGQRHVAELEAAAALSSKVGVESHCVVQVPLDDGGLRMGALTDHERPITGDGGFSDSAAPNGLPSTFVPGRNLVFLALAAIRAVKVRARHIVTGVCQTDYSGYPDCREAFIRAMDAAVNQAMPEEVRPLCIWTPLMNLSKRETVDLMVELGGLSLLTDTVTCYNGERPGCGRCPACQLRAQGFAEAGIGDPACASWAESKWGQ